jgi:putative flippase GtrA
VSEPATTPGPAARLRGWLGRFALVGAGITALDVTLLVELDRLGAPLVLADLVAVGAAAVLSYLAHRTFSFHNDPFVRWVRRPSAFLGVAAGAAAVDLGLLTVAIGAGLPLLPAKLVAVAGAGAVRLLSYRWLLFQGTRQSQDRRSNRPSPTDPLRFSVVVPAYEEAARIGTTVDRLRDALAGVGRSGGAEIVVVDDGSPDGTAEAARAAAVEGGPAGVQVVVVAQPANRGKGAAVRAGMAVARGRSVAFTDADLAYSPDQLLTLLAALEDGWDLVVGSRHHPGGSTLVAASAVREVGSRLINLTTLALLLGQYRDTQCGLKGFRSDVARLLFGQSRVDGFAFDVELFHLAERYELSLLEVPVHVSYSERSTVRVARDAVRLLADLVRIRGWAKSGVYRGRWPPVAQATAAGRVGPRSAGDGDRLGEPHR